MFKNKNNIHISIIFFLAFLVYGNTIFNDYAWDDLIVITDNARVQKGISGIPDLFLKYNSDYRADKYGYRPIVLTSFAIEYGLFRNNPGVAHFMNVLYFAVLCSVMFVVLKKLFYDNADLAPFLITLLFLAHPVHVEAVANIKSRDEILSLLFSLLSLQQLINYQAKQKIKSLLYFILWFLLAFLSKESAVSFLLVALLYLAYPGNRNELKKMLWPAMCCLVLFITAVIVVKVYASSTLGAESSAGQGIFYENAILGNSFFNIAFSATRFANAFTLLLLYLKSFYYPVTQLYFSGYNQIPVANWREPAVIFSCVFHLGVLLFALLNFKKHKELSYGILFYFLTIVFYLHIIRALADTMADRFLFTPSLGLAIATVFGIGAVLKIDFKTVTIASLFGPGKKNKSYNILKYSFLLIFFMLGAKSFSRNMDWKDDVTLITHDMPYLEQCARAHTYYANVLKKKLHDEGYDANMEASMIEHFRKSIAISKEAYYSYLGLGTYYCEVKNFKDGLIVLDTLATLFPGVADPNFFLGQALYDTRDYPKAVLYLEKAKKIAPNVKDMYHALALAYSGAGNYDSAFATINAAAKKFIDSAMVCDVLGNIYFDKGILDTSATYTLKMLNFGGNPQAVYGKVIGRFQLKHLDTPAAFYYHQALAAGIFQPRH